MCSRRCMGEEHSGAEKTWQKKCCRCASVRLIHTQRYTAYGSLGMEVLCIEWVFVHSVQSTFKICTAASQSVSTVRRYCSALGGQWCERVWFRWPTDGTAPSIGRRQLGRRARFLSWETPLKAEGKDGFTLLFRTENLLQFSAFFALF